MARRPVDLELIKELAELLRDTDLTEIEVGADESRIRVARNLTSVAAAPVAAAPPAAAPPPSAAPAPAESSAPAAPAEGAVTSPMVGTAFLASEPGKPTFVRVGDQVAEGDTLLIVEAMKVMNPITAPRAGTVQSILVENEQPVEFGQPLVVLG